ncbi:hypothetical protein [Actinopolymorpha pittospori]|uniref:Uncharacterized protein n=1 Tax=Actinopolymorpha pittospori TaxID=648752 RepID=A0A927R982_9ACTN|nr:hypothetical protein [Actinopolymorpha pittospori]MBE1607532.1 hypothetical protein [Actinopolymorpha pittospori]
MTTSSGLDGPDGITGMRGGRRRLRGMRGRVNGGGMTLVDATAATARSVAVIGATVIGATVICATVIGATVIGATVIGATVIGATVIGATAFGVAVFGVALDATADISVAFGVDVGSTTRVTGLVVIGVEVRVELVGPAQLLLDLGPGRTRVLSAQPSRLGEAVCLPQLFLRGRAELARTGTDLFGFGILPRRAATDLDGSVASFLRLDPALLGPTL